MDGGRNVESLVYCVVFLVFLYAQLPFVWFVLVLMVFLSMVLIYEFSLQRSLKKPVGKLADLRYTPLCSSMCVC